jgi:hypothetical protein
LNRIFDWLITIIMASRARNKLNVKQVAAITATGIYSDGGGLYLRVRPLGRSWFYIGTIDGERLELGLGSAQAWICS